MLLSHSLEQKLLRLARPRIRDGIFLKLSTEFLRGFYCSTYVLGTTVLGLLVPSNDLGLNQASTKGTAAACPFIIVLRSDGLAAAGNAPIFFLRTSRNGLPYAAVMFTSSFALHGYMGTAEGSGRVFGRYSSKADGHLWQTIFR